MKIFIVQSHLGGGGAERVGSMLANGFLQKNHEVYLITNLLDEVQYSLNEGVTLLNLVSSNQGKIRKWGSAIYNLRKYVIMHKPDVIIGIMQLSSFVSKMACIGTKTHVIMTEHDSFERPKSAPMPKVEYFCKYYLNQIYECVTVLTQADRDYIGKRLKNVFVMPNPLLLNPVREIPQKKKVVLAAGRLESWHYKGFDVLIRAWALVNGRLKIDNGQLSSKGESWKLQIAGTGSEESLNYLKQLCKENGVENSVEFLGFKKDVENLYQDASIFVLSSRYEGFGLVLIEAMSQGCACIACDYKGRQREIMCPEGQGSMLNVQSSNNKVELCETGILCEPDDVEALAEAMKKMIMDDEYRESVRAKAIERSEYFSLSHITEKWDNLLMSILNTGN